MNKDEKKDLPPTINDKNPLASVKSASPITEKRNFSLEEQKSTSSDKEKYDGQ